MKMDISKYDVRLVHLLIKILDLYEYFKVSDFCPN